MAEEVKNNVSSSKKEKTDSLRNAGIFASGALLGAGIGGYAVDQHHTEQQVRETQSMANVVRRNSHYRETQLFFPEELLKLKSNEVFDLEKVKETLGIRNIRYDKHDRPYFTMIRVNPQSSSKDGVIQKMNVVIDTHSLQHAYDEINKEMKRRKLQNQGVQR